MASLGLIRNSFSRPRGRFSEKLHHNKKKPYPLCFTLLWIRWFSRSLHSTAFQIKEVWILFNSHTQADVLTYRLNLARLRRQLSEISLLGQIVSTSPTSASREFLVPLQINYIKLSFIYLYIFIYLSKQLYITIHLQHHLKQCSGPESAPGVLSNSSKSVFLCLMALKNTCPTCYGSSTDPNTSPIT